MCFTGGAKDPSTGKLRNEPGSDRFHAVANRIATAQFWLGLPEQRSGLSDGAYNTSGWQAESSGVESGLARQRDDAPGMLEAHLGRLECSLGGTKYQLGKQVLAPGWAK